QWQGPYDAFPGMAATVSSVVARQQAKLARKGLSGASDDFYETHCKAGIYTHIRSLYNARSASTGVHTAYYVFVLNYCYGGLSRYNSKGEFNVPYAGSYNAKNIDISRFTNPDLINKLNNTQITNLDFSDF